ncbi:hypothetical protein BLOT_012732 [Blomia tropicalis]|nr:hypothetical protein BLOT_012732 [Blomia tropicalis]
MGKDDELINYKSFLKISVCKSKGFYPKPKFKRHLYVHLANAMQSYENGHKNIEYNVLQWESIGKSVKFENLLILQYVLKI